MLLDLEAVGAKKSCAILSTMEQQELIEKIKRLPQDRVAEVENFVDSLARREVAIERIFTRHSPITPFNTRGRMPTSILTLRPPRPITCSNKLPNNEKSERPMT